MGVIQDIEAWFSAEEQAVVSLFVEESKIVVAAFKDEAGVFLSDVFGKLKEAATALLTGVEGYFAKNPGDVHGAVAYVLSRLKDDYPDLLKFIETEGFTLLVRVIATSLAG